MLFETLFDQCVSVHGENSGEGFVEECLFPPDSPKSIVGLKEHWNPSKGDWNPTTDSNGNGGVGGNGGGNTQAIGNNITTAVTAGVGAAVAGVPGLIVGKNVGDSLGSNPTAPNAPGQDPTLSSIKAQQVGDARTFRQNLGQTQQNLYEGAYKNERQNLASNIATNRSNANSRGLLNSGMEQANELGIRNASSANLAQGRTEINNSTEDAARQMEANAIQSGVQQQQSLASVQDATMQQALANMTARRQALTGVGQGLGSVAGTVAANRSSGGSTSYGVNQPTYYGT